MHSVNPVRARQRRACSRVPNRSLHVVDIENLVGHGRATAQELTAAAAVYMSAAAVSSSDLVVIGCDRGLRLNAGLAWPGARVIGGTGKDGAETALLSDLSVAATARRFRQVVIGSGDHAFAGFARDLRSLGTVVGVVAPEDGLAGDLARAASWTRAFASEPLGGISAPTAGYPVTDGKMAA